MAPPPAAPETGRGANTARGVKPFDTTGVAPCVVQAYHACREWVAAIIHQTRPPYMLSLLGRSGCGKTHLAKNARAVLGARGVCCTMRAWTQILTDMREGNESFILHSLRRHHVLILDDVGAENLASDWNRENSTEKLCRVLDGREGKWTLLTSNFSSELMAKRYDARVASRIHRNGAAIIQMPDAADYALARFKGTS